MRYRLWSWVSACYFGILGIALLEFAIIGFSLLLLYHLAGQPASTVHIYGNCLVMMGFSGWLDRMSIRRTYLGEMRTQRNDPVVSRRLRFLERLLEELCDKREHPLPKILFVRSGRANDRIMVGMMDNFFDDDVLCLHPDVVGILTEAQMRAVLAHELRHSNATENIISRLCLLATYAFAGCGVAQICMSIFGSDRWWYTLLTIPILLFALFLCFFLRNLRSQLTEYKTDALSTLESEDPESLISALSMVWRVVSVDFLFLKNKRNLWWMKVFNTHPSNSARAKALRWIHG